MAGDDLARRAGPQAEPQTRAGGEGACRPPPRCPAPPPRLARASSRQRRILRGEHLAEEAERPPTSMPGPRVEALRRSSPRRASGSASAGRPAASTGLRPRGGAHPWPMGSPMVAACATARRTDEDERVLGPPGQRIRGGQRACGGGVHRGHVEALADLERPLEMGDGAGVLAPAEEQEARAQVGEDLAIRMLDGLGEVGWRARLPRPPRRSRPARPATTPAPSPSTPRAGAPCRSARARDRPGAVPGCGARARRPGGTRHRSGPGARKVLAGPPTVMSRMRAPISTARRPYSAASGKSSVTV